MYSSERKISQIINGHAATLAKFRVKGNSTDSTLFCFAEKTEERCKLTVLEIGGSSEWEYRKFSSHVINAYFDTQNDDYPANIIINEKYGIIFLVTMFGFVEVYDLEVDVTNFGLCL